METQNYFRNINYDKQQENVDIVFGLIKFQCYFHSDAFEGDFTLIFISSVNPINCELKRNENQSWIYFMRVCVIRPSYRKRIKREN